MQSVECKMQNGITGQENVSVDKSFEFAVRIVNLYKYLTQELKGILMAICKTASQSR